MRTQDTPGSFISLIRTFVASVKRISDGANLAATAPVVDNRTVPIHPRADAVAHLLLLRMLIRRIQRPLTEEGHLGQTSFPLQQLPSTQTYLALLLFLGGAGVTHTTAPQRRAK